MPKFLFDSPFILLHSLSRCGRITHADLLQWGVWQDLRMKKQSVRIESMPMKIACVVSVLAFLVAATAAAGGTTTTKG